MFAIQDWTRYVDNFLFVNTIQHDLVQLTSTPCTLLTETSPIFQCTYSALGIVESSISFITSWHLCGLLFVSTVFLVDYSVIGT